MTTPRFYRGVPLPSQSDVAKDIRGILAQSRRLGVFKDEDNVDIRLRVHDNGDWTMHAGDASYDTDHRGHWGSAVISEGESDASINEIATALLGEVIEAIASR